MAENLKTFKIAATASDYQERLNELDQAIASVKKNITYLDTLNIVDAVIDSDNFAAQVNALTPNSSLVINTEPFNEGGINYSRGDIILKDANDIIHHIPGQQGGIYYPNSITPNGSNYNIQYKFTAEAPMGDDVVVGVGSVISSPAPNITFTGLTGGEASNSFIYGNWCKLNEFAVGSIEPMIEFYLTDITTNNPSSISNMEKIELEYSISGSSIIINESTDTLSYIWVKVK